MKTLILLAPLALTASTFGAAAIAAPPATREAPGTKVVRYADLDLSSMIGQKRLKDRVSFAAYLVCLVNSPPSPSTAIADPECFRAAMKEGSLQMQQAIALATSHTIVASASQPSTGGEQPR